MLEMRVGLSQPRYRRWLQTDQRAATVILISNTYSRRQCPPVADENCDTMRTTSMMDDRNASALIPLRKSSIAVLSPRLCCSGIVLM